jgi:Rha family phage regulatory protein
MNKLVMVQRGKGTTTSLLVAEKYGKRHDNVVRDIRKLMSMIPQNRLLNFEERNYIDDRGKTYPYFVMTRDGVARGETMNELVMVQRGKGTTTSLLVAEKYGKRHDNVVRDIRKLMSMIPQNRLLNFEERNYIDDRGKTYPYFVMTRDGVARGETMNELVMVQRGKGTTTSLLVAAKFGKRHNSVLRAIKNLECSASFTERNFAPSKYEDSTGRTLPMYFITRDGFTFLAMGFTGKEASEWKEKFIDAFNRMERIILNQQNLSWQQARLDGKNARRDLTDVIGAFVEYASGQGSTNARMYYTVISKLTNQALGLIKSASKKPFRDVLDGIHLSFLSSAEYVARQALLDGMTEKLHYKEIYKLARERITAFAVTLPRPMIAA